MEYMQQPLDDFSEKIKKGSGSLLQSFIGSSESEGSVKSFTNALIELQTHILLSFVSILKDLGSSDPIKPIEALRIIIEDFNGLKIALTALLSPEQSSTE